MGYESRIYLALPSPSMANDVYVHDPDTGAWTPETTGRKALYCQVVATLDLCKTSGAVYDVIRKAIKVEKARLVNAPKAPGYGIYLSGNEFADRDCYDDPVAPLPLGDLLDAVNVAYDLEGYRRYGLARDLLRSWQRLQGDFGGPDHTIVLHYGH